VIAAVVFLGLSVSEIFERQKWCFKREKKKRDKENFPPYPLYKKESGVVEKDENTPPLYNKGVALLFDCTKKRFCVMVTQRRSFLGKFHILFLGVTKLIPNFAIDMCAIASVLTLVSMVRARNHSITN